MATEGGGMGGTQWAEPPGVVDEHIFPAARHHPPESDDAVSFFLSPQSPFLFFSR